MGLVHMVVLIDRTLLIVSCPAPNSGVRQVHEELLAQSEMQALCAPPLSVSR